MYKEPQIIKKTAQYKVNKRLEQVIHKRGHPNRQYTYGKELNIRDNVNKNYS